MKLYFNPETDITTYELAIIYANVVVQGPLSLALTSFDVPPELPEAIKRHFKPHRLNTADEVAT